MRGSIRLTPWLLGSAILIIASPTHALLLRGGSGTIPTFEGGTWHEVLEQVACQYVTKVGKDLKIAARLIVDGKTFENPTITEESRVKEVERRCFPKG